MLSIPRPGSYGGIVTTKNSDKREIYKLLIGKFLDIAKKEGCILATIITPVFFEDLELYMRTFLPEYLLENKYQYLILDKPINYNRSTRRNIRKAAENGVIIREAKENEMSEWYNIHKKRMMSIKRDPLPRRIFDNSNKILIPKGMGKLFVAELNGKIIGGAFHIFHQKAVDCYMLSSDPDYMNMGVNHLIIDYAIKWARLNKFKYYNFQGSSSVKSVSLFKEQWGCEVGNHHILTRKLGDIENLKSVKLGVIQEEYKWHYVLPYTEFEQK